MIWVLLAGVVGGLAIVTTLVAERRAELRRMEASLEARESARRKGAHRARLQYPQVDLSRCLGCGTCIAACPEEGVLELIHGQAMVVHGARCVGHGACARECPTGAIVVTLGDLETRRDIPALDESLQVPSVAGLYLAGEITGFALIKTAISHGTLIAREAARRRSEGQRKEGVLDLLIVGAGPAGFACSLEAKAQGLWFMTIEQERLGGTVAQYPRRKLVMTQPVELPLHGKFRRTSLEKEELMELWEELAARHDLPIRTGVTFLGLERDGDGVFTVHTSKGDVRAHNVCLALGRRGSPRKLGVPGEDLTKVAYGLVDAQSYQGRRILVVGGGDSAIEAALGLSEQPGNTVHLSYRRHAFFRLKARNEERIEQAMAEGRVIPLLQTQVVEIRPDAVHLVQGEGENEQLLALPNDDVFVLAGGVPPFELLERSGVSFDPSERSLPASDPEATTGLLRALLLALLLGVASVAWVAVFRSYYLLPRPLRPETVYHDFLHSSDGAGLFFGIAAAAFVAINLAYLLRRSPAIPLRWGSLRAWMTCHIVTGILALLLAVLHSAMAPLDTVGGHSLWALAVLAMTGAIGRYFYSFVPRAANGRELELDEVRTQVESLAAEWDRTHPQFAEQIRSQSDALVRHGYWGRSALRRLWAFLRMRANLRRTITRLREEGQRQGIALDQLGRVLLLVERGQRLSFAAAYYEEVRGLLATWRFLHRWVAVVLVVLLIVHVLTAVQYGETFG